MSLMVSFRPLLVGFILILGAVSCVSNDSGTSTLATPEVDIITKIATPPLPVVITVATAPPDREVEIPGGSNSADPGESSNSAGAAVEEATGEFQANATSTQSEPATPRPTYTVPGSPEPSPWDHYWLRRPVPEGTAVWTDKAYPFGATRGGTLRPHHGVEFNVPAGTDVIASADGVIVYAASDDSQLIGPQEDFYGNVIVIEHGFQHNNQPVFTLYGHLSEILVEAGQEVRSGEQIGSSGSTGVADGAHLHFEVRVGENSYLDSRNPLLWLYPFPDNGVVAGRITWSDGGPAAEVPLNLRRLDAESPYSATTTYPADSTKSDLNWNENFAFDDVAAGYYELTIGTGDTRERRELWVFPGVTNFVEVVLSN